MKLHLVLALAGVTVACAHQPRRTTTAHHHPAESNRRQEYADGSRYADDRVVTDDAPRHALDRQNANADGYAEPTARGDGLADDSVVDTTARDPTMDATQLEVERRRAEHAADNTAQNEVGPGEVDGLTPFDQGASESDRKTTQAIRKALMADDSLSFNAKNIKVITRDGYVVLRGPVNNQKERAAVQQLANQVVGAGARVDNQLQVK